MNLFLSTSALLGHITGETVLLKVDKLRENGYYLFSIPIVIFALCLLLWIRIFEWNPISIEGFQMAFKLLMNWSEWV